MGARFRSPAPPCPHCAAEIRPRDNIPVLSYCSSAAAAATAGAAIGWRYPAVESRQLCSRPPVSPCSAYRCEPLRRGVLRCARDDLRDDIERRIVPNGSFCRRPRSSWRFRLPAPSVEWAAAGFGAALFLFIAALAYPRGMDGRRQARAPPRRRDRPQRARGADVAWSPRWFPHFFCSATRRGGAQDGDPLCPFPGARWPGGPVCRPCIVHWYVSFLNSELSRHPEPCR